MKKETPWFKHHTNSSRTVKMMQMKAIYDHWGSGVYWEVCEVLRGQQGYLFQCDEFALKVISDMIGVKSFEQFKKWFFDCIKIGLLEKTETHFFSPGLNESMKAWETSKANGSKGGRPPGTKKKTKGKTKPGTKKKPLRIEENRIEENNILSLPHPSEEFRSVWEKLRSQKKWVKKSNDALEASLETLAEATEPDAIKMMKNSIAGNWQGLFPLDERNRNSKQQQPSKGFTVRADAN